MVNQVQNNSTLSVRMHFLMKVTNVLLFKLGKCVYLVFRIVSNMFIRQKFDLAFESGPYL
jgi:hypothetical protein